MMDFPGPALNPTPNKKIIIYAVAALVLVAAVVLILVWNFPNNKNVGPGGPGVKPATPKTVFPVPPGTVVPSVNSTTTPADTAKPTSITNTGGIGITNFNVAIADGRISPANVNVYVGTPMNISFFSDKAYTFSQPDNGLSWSVPAGGSFTIQFQANQPGKFIYYCPSCGGPSKGPVGYFVAVSK